MTTEHEHADRELAAYQVAWGVPYRGGAFGMTQAERLATYEWFAEHLCSIESSSAERLTSMAIEYARLFEYDLAKVMLWIVGLKFAGVVVMTEATKRAIPDLFWDTVLTHAFNETQAVEAIPYASTDGFETYMTRVRITTPNMWDRLNFYRAKRQDYWAEMDNRLLARYCSYALPQA